MTTQRYFSLIRKAYFPTLLIPFVLMSACDNLLEVDLPTSSVSSALIFEDDITASSAVKGMYVDMLDASAFASGSDRSVVALAGLSSDELINFVKNLDYTGFELNEIPPDSRPILGLWSSLYKSIYEANSILTGLNGSSGLSADTKRQLEGEALFVRAFCHFYLVNLFGDVPLVLSDDYRINATARRTPESEVYSSIISDLTKAKAMLTPAYSGLERVRPNEATATALLSRVYLYLNQWTEAAENATEIINNAALYSLLPNINEVFLANSKEAIWQLSLPPTPSVTTLEGNYFIVQSQFDLRFNVLRNDVTAAFEVGDQRLTNWVKSFNSPAGVVYFPFKYKIKTGSNPTAEYSVVFRLAEQYLIRAEARAQMHKLPEAIEDLDAIRKRAGIPLIKDTDPGIDKEALLMKIEHERRIELLAEWGHRWFDLKRLGRADDVLGPQKANWSSNDTLYPIPQSEINNNPFMGKQNPGY